MISSDRKDAGYHQYFPVELDSGLEQDAVDVYRCNVRATKRGAGAKREVCGTERFLIDADHAGQRSAWVYSDPDLSYGAAVFATGVECRQ